MSLPVTFVALPATAPPADPACPGAPSAPSASEISAPPFSRVLADQRRAEAPPSQSKQADAANAHTTERAPTPSADATRNQGKADADHAKDDQDEKDSVLALDPDVSGLPDAPLAALTLEIAAQTAAQLRGARARAAQADPSAVSMARNGAASRLSVAATQSDAATSRLSAEATTAPRPDQDSLTLSPLTLADAASGDPSTHATSVTSGTPRPLTHRSQATLPMATTRPALQTGKPSTPASETTALARVAPALDLARESTTASATSATPPSAHELSLTGLAPPQPAPHLPTPTTGTPADAPTTVWQVAAPLGAPHWGAALGRQLVTLGRHAQDSTQTAELRLDPPELGPLRVTLTVNDGVAHAAFASPHASVRQAVEAAMSQLQSALAQSGIALGEANVSDQETPNQFAFAQPNGRPHVPTSPDTPVDAPAPAVTLPTHALVDTFV